VISQTRLRKFADPARTPGPFSHLEYAERRLRAFEASLERLGPGGAP